MTRVVVVGGGVVGGCAADRLRELGVDAVVVDSREPGTASHVGGGVVFPGPLPGTPEPLQELTYRAVSHLFSRSLRPEAFARVGLIDICEPGSSLDKTYDRAASLIDMPRMEHLGSVTRLDAGGPAYVVPFLPESVAGVRITGFGRVDGRELCRSLLDSSDVITGKASLTASGRRVSVRVDGELVEGDAVIVAAGAWAGELCRPLGVSLPVVPHKGQAIRIDIGRSDAAEWPIVQTPEWSYFVGYSSGQVYAGGTSEPDAGFDDRVTATSMRTLLDYALDTAPGLTDGAVHTSAGLRPRGLDGLPLLGPVARFDNLVVATGLDTMGLSLGPYAGAVAADLALGHAVDLDLAPFVPDRTVDTP